MTVVGEEKTAAAMSTAGQPLFSRRIEFHPARRPYTGVPLSSGEFRLEILNPRSVDEGRVASVSGVERSTAETSAQGKISTGGEFHEHGLDPELGFRISFQRIGAGLENLGNTCYLNSVLQCLTYTEPFAAYLQSGKHKSTCRAAGFCAMCALQNHVMDALKSTGKILRPFHLVRNLRCISRNFRNSRQEDAHEYMVNLLESMHKCCLPSGVQSESSSAYEKSLVHKIFGGQLRSQVKCMQCSYCSNKFDPFLDLSLEIVKADSLRKAFAHFTAMEQLDGGERQYQCQRCKEKVQAFKQLTIHKAPYVLNIHLKRFGSSIRGEKINKKVEFEPTLDLKPFFSGAHEGELKYTLYGVLVHAGWSTHSGHYFCYVRTSAGLWYSLDDNHVSQVSEKIVLSREAYMLFYVRDRTSAMKQQVQVNLNANISANSTTNKEAPSAERKLNNAVYNSTKPRNDAIVLDLSASVMDNPRQHFFKNQEPLVQYDGHTTTTKGCCLQVNNNVSSNGLHKAVWPRNKTELLAPVKSQLPFDTIKKKNVKESPPESATQQKIETNCTPSGNDDKRPLSRYNLLYGDSQQTRVMPKKRKILLLAEGSYIGRKQLFLMSLRLRKTKKKKTKRRIQNSRNKMKRRTIDMCTDSQGASTSETFRTVVADSIGSFKKNLHPTSGKKLKRENGVKAGHDYSQMDDTEIDRSFITCDKPGTWKRSSRSLKCKEGQQNAEDENILQHCPASLLKESLREVTVGRWDVEASPAPRMNDLEDCAKRNIGYLLDEWDAEYDKGKRKKLKSRQWFNNGPNPFQKTANLKAQQRMVQTSFGKEQLRI